MFLFQKNPGTPIDLEQDELPPRPAPIPATEAMAQIDKNIDTGTHGHENSKGHADAHKKDLKEPRGGFKIYEWDTPETRAKKWTGKRHWDAWKGWEKQKEEIHFLEYVRLGAG